MKIMSVFIVVHHMIIWWGFKMNMLDYPYWFKAETIYNCFYQNKNCESFIDELYDILELNDNNAYVLIDGEKCYGDFYGKAPKINQKLIDELGNIVFEDFELFVNWDWVGRESFIDFLYDELGFNQPDVWDWDKDYDFDKVWGMTDEK